MGTVDVLQLATFIVILSSASPGTCRTPPPASTGCTPRSRARCPPSTRRWCAGPTPPLELANSGVLDPASALLIADAATESIERTTEQPVTGDLLDGQHFGGREQVESDLSEALRAALTGEVVTDLRDRDVDLVADALDRIAASGLRVQLARRFHNDATREVRRVRAKRVGAAVPAVGLRRAARAGHLRRRAAPALAA